MKKISILLVSLVILLCSCESSAVSRGRRTYEKYFHKVLKDPESFKVYSEKYVEAPDGYEVTWTLDYGAKNSYGAMVRKEVTFTTTVGLIKIDGDLVDTNKFD